MDFRDILRRRQIEYKDHGTDRNEIRLCCPFCPDRGKTPDIEFKLGVNVRSNRGHCFRCDYSTRHIVESLNRKFSLGQIIRPVKPETKSATKIVVPEHSFLLYRDWQKSDWATRAKEYLESRRKMDLETMEEKMVLFTEVGRYSHRAIFPVIAHEQLVGLVARAITKTQTPRYLNSEGVKYIWNLPETPVKEDRVMLCEGIFKGLALEKILDGEKFSVGALLGHTISTEQIQQLKGAREIYIFPDPDPEGLKGAIKIAYKLRNRFKVYLPKLIPVKQADELEYRQMLKVLASYSLFSDSLLCRYQFEAMKRGVNEE